MNKKILFSVTDKDCKFTYTRGSGKGGQKRNKTSSAVRCHHVPSGAMGYSDDTRSQLQNKKIAFSRMAKTPEFNCWHVKTLAEILKICDPKDLEVHVR